MTSRLLPIYLLLLLIASCDANTSTTPQLQNYKILEISHYEMTLNNKPANYIRFGLDDTQNCSLSILKSAATRNYTISISGSTSTEVDIDLSCMINGSYYAMSSDNSTYIKLTTIEANENKVVYQLSSTLITPDNQSFFDLNDITLTVPVSSRLQP